MTDIRDRLAEIIGSTPATINYAHIEQIADAILARFDVREPEDASD